MGDGKNIPIRSVQGDAQEKKTPAETVDAVNEGPAEDEKVPELPMDNAELRQLLDAAKQEAENNYDRFLRACADLENFKKRAAREREELQKFASETLLRQILSVVDNLERAIVSAASEKAGSQTILEGVNLTLTELLKLLESQQVKPVASIGQPFDPVYHQAFMQEETNRFPENTVVGEIQKGYTLHDRLLRPALVVVSKAKTMPDSPNESSAQAPE